jgi:DNA-binding NarL/FixJ family response regulator
VESKTHVAIVHRERVVRTGLESIIGSDGRFHLLDPVRDLSSLPPRPFDVCLSDIYRVGDPEEIARWLRVSSVVVFTNVDHFEALTAAWVGGARDVLRTDDDAATIRNTVLSAGTAPPDDQPIQLGAHVAAALKESIEHVGASTLTVGRDGAQQQQAAVNAGLTVSVGLLELITRMAANARIDALLQDGRVHKAFDVPDEQAARSRYVAELEQFRHDCESYGLGAIPRMNLSWGIGRTEKLEPRPYLACLTPQQRSILELFANGLTTKQVAHRLHLAERTVRTHTTAAMDKYGLTGRRSEQLVMLVAQFVTGKHADPRDRSGATRRTGLPRRRRVVALRLGELLRGPC